MLEQFEQCWYLLERCRDSRSSPCCQRAAPAGAGSGGGRAGLDVRGGGSCLWHHRQHGGAGLGGAEPQPRFLPLAAETAPDTRGSAPARPGLSAAAAKGPCAEGLAGRARPGSPLSSPRTRYSWPPPLPGLSGNTGLPRSGVQKASASRTSSL